MNITLGLLSIGPWTTGLVQKAKSTVDSAGAVW